MTRERSLRLPSDGMSTSLSRSAASSRTPVSRPKIVTINGGTVSLTDMDTDNTGFTDNYDATDITATGVT